ncbi:LuxR C-terminal-related transcriptional regulator [Brevibacillus laterosporus]|uniref:LuxR C-terminal-related transcriptional regulator n=1 Tax=Brevibacillus laterosporus TaxID=1465 RepID=UPI001EF396CC|nr:LuxR C-terminal-related transcriptional regulator [Brevibacillus laterosporus]MCG7318946.1 LuxR C-terminal-related transcriptional regulator [Brevibacillus laterosporus]
MRSKMKAIQHKLMTLAKNSASSQNYRIALLTHLRSAVPFDAACCTIVDPQTLLSIGAITEEGVEAIHHHLFEYEYLREDFIPYDQLVKADEHVATLSKATGGNLEQSARYRNVLFPAGFADEMRAALMYEGACWGYLTLFRHHDRPLFHEDERQFISALVPLIASHLRQTSLFLPTEEATWVEESPGIMVLSDQLTILSSNKAADNWLALLQKWERIDSSTLPRPIRVVCFRALSETVTLKQQPFQAKVCIRLSEGPYLTIQASKLTSESDSVQLAVWFQPAKPSDILPLISEAYELSVREKQILDQIVKGFSTKEIAHSLHISAYTVQDHLKSIFVKTGVTSRRQLIWHLFSRFSVQNANR